jgi:hypothetical protein
LNLCGGLAWPSITFWRKEHRQDGELCHSGDLSKIKCPCGGKRFLQARRVGVDVTTIDRVMVVDPCEQTVEQGNIGTDRQLVAMAAALFTCSR